MKIKVSEIKGKALNWAVATSTIWCIDSPSCPCILYPLSVNDPWEDGTPRTEDEREQRKGYYAMTSVDALNYTEDWALGGPLKSALRISTQQKHDGWWMACIYDINDEMTHTQLSHSELEAAMRCLVASKVGEAIKVPNQVLGVEGQRHEERIAELPDLKSRAGPAYTLWQVASQALQEAGGDAEEVNWVKVENDTIERCINVHRQDAGDVIIALTRHSPNTLTTGQVNALQRRVNNVVRNSEKLKDSNTVTHGVEP